MNFHGFPQSAWTWLRRVVKSGGRSLSRNAFLSIATVLVISLMLFVFNLILALNFAADSVVSNVGEKLDISIEILDGVENYSIQTFAASLREQPGVKEVILVTKEEALSGFGAKYPNIITFLNYHKLNNPLPNVVRVVTDDVSRNNQLLAYLESPQFSQIVNQQELRGNTEQKTRNEKILNITRFIQSISFWLIIIFTAVGVTIIFNSISINIYSHRQEVEIMKLVGAKNSFIRAGFVMEGILFAVAALIISLAFSRLVLVYLTQNLVGVVTNESLLTGMNAIFFHFNDNLWLTFIWQLLAVATAGALSSYLAIELYLRRSNNP